MPKGTKILLVDDDKMLIELYKERLELAGYQVEISRDGEEGLAKVHQIKPDLVLLDIMMPKVNGYEALASIKSDPATKDIPVIILSALMRDINKTKAIESGADDYIIKSEAMPADVIKKIENVLQKYHKVTPEEPVKPAAPEIPSEPPKTTPEPSPAAAKPAPPPEPPKTEPPVQEVQFESFGATPGANLGQPPAAGGQNLSGSANPAVANSPAAEAKPSPLVIFFLILICILILASDLFFYLKYITSR